MKKLIYILPLLFIGCKTMYVKNTGEHPETFNVKEKKTTEDMVFYFDDEYYIYHKRDKMKIGETRAIKPIWFDKYLKLKK